MQTSRKFSSATFSTGRAALVLFASALIVWGFMGETRRVDPSAKQRRAALRESDNSAASNASIDCTLIGIARSLVQDEPLDPIAIVRYAGVLEQERARGCQEPEGGGNVEKNEEIEEIVEFALARAPRRREALLVAAMLAQRRADVAKQNEYIRRALLTPGAFSEQHKRTLSALLDSAQTVNEAVPRDLRSAILVSQIKDGGENLGQRRFGSAAMTSAIAALQTVALSQSGFMVQSSAVQAAIQAEPRRDMLTLETLSRYAASGELFSKIDAHRAVLARAGGDSELADFFAARSLMSRSLMSRSALMRGVILSDSRPETGRIVSWRGTDFLAFDVSKRSLGLALPRAVVVQAIQLSSADISAILSPDEVQLWSSLDNEAWQPVAVSRTLSARVDSVTRMLLFVALPANSRFLKVHFSVPIRRERFRDSLDRLVDVFG